MRNYDIKLSRYSISRWRQRELVAYFKQYPELLRKLRQMSFVVSPRIDDSARGTQTDCALERDSLQRAYLSTKIDLINRALSEVESDMQEPIRQNVCYGQTLSRIQVGYPWMSSHLFYRCRREALQNLNRLLEENGQN